MQQKELSKRLREARQKSGYTSAQMAALVGVTPRIYEGYETGTYTPSAIILSRIAYCLDVQTGQLTGSDDLPELHCPTTDEAVAYEALCARIAAAKAEIEAEPSGNIVYEPGMTGL